MRSAGPLPPSWSMLTNLSELQLHYNGLTGESLSSMFVESCHPSSSQAQQKFTSWEPHIGPHCCPRFCRDIAAFVVCPGKLDYALLELQQYHGCVVLDPTGILTQYGFASHMDAPHTASTQFSCCSMLCRVFATHMVYAGKLERSSTRFQQSDR